MTDEIIKLLLFISLVSIITLIFENIKGRLSFVMIALSIVAYLYLYFNRVNVDSFIPLMSV